MTDQPPKSCDPTGKESGPRQEGRVGEADGSRLTLIESRATWRTLDLAELWRYRELLYFFAWRHIKVRYKQTELGAAWAVIQPLVTTGVFAMLFGLLMAGHEPTIPEVPYVVSTFCAMLAWQLFAESLARSGDSLIDAQHLITKVYFPLVLLPLSAVMTALVDFAIAAAVLAGMIVWCGIAPTWTVLAFPLFVLLAVATSLAVGLWLAALSAVYRDFRFVRPFLIALGMYVSPVIYTTASLRPKLPDWALLVYGLNPMAGAIEGFRWALFAKAEPPWPVLVPSVLTAAAVLLGGLRFFHRMERTIVDVI